MSNDNGLLTVNARRGLTRLMVGCGGLLTLIALVGVLIWAWPTYIAPMLTSKPAVAPTSAPVAQATAAPKATTLPNVVPTKIPEILKPTQSNLPVVRVAMPSFAPYFVPIAGDVIGVFAKRGIRLEIFPIGKGQNDWDEDVQAEKLRKGEIDILFTTLEKVPLDPTIGKVTVLVDQTTGADKIVGKEKKPLNDIIGKRVAYAKGSVGEFFALYVLNLMQVETSKVTLVPEVDVPSAVQLFVDGKVDYVSGWTPDIEPALAKGAEIISSKTVRVPVDVMIYSPASTNKADAMQAYTEGYLESLKILFENPKIAEQALIKWGHSDWTYVEKEGDWVTALGDVAQATLVDNETFLVSDTSALTSRFAEAQAVWKWAGRGPKDAVNPNTMFDGSYIKKAAAKKELHTNATPVNPDFLLTSKSQAPKLSAASLGNNTTTLAVLPFKDVKFQPDSTLLTDEDKANIKKFVAPVLLNSNSIYLKLTGSAAWPNNNYTADDIQAFALARAQAVQKFLTSPEVGVHPSYIIVTAVRPIGVMNAVDQSKARFVQFELIVEGR